MCIAEAYFVLNTVLCAPEFVFFFLAKQIPSILGTEKLILENRASMGLLRLH